MYIRNRTLYECDGVCKPPRTFAKVIADELLIKHPGALLFCEACAQRFAGEVYAREGRVVAASVDRDALMRFVLEGL